MLAFNQSNEILDMFDVMGSVEAGTRQYLTFELNREHYGVEILRVQEIRGWAPVTPIPNTPPHLCGVLNLRGAIVPIVDLRLLFEMPFQPYSKTTVVVVLKVESDNPRRVGVVVDAVSDACNLQPEEMQPAPAFGEQLNTAFITGMISRGDNMLMLLDIDQLLSSERIG